MDERCAKAVQLYWREGLGLRETGARLGVGTHLVKRLLAEAGHGVRRRGETRRAFVDFRIATALAPRMSRRALAEQLGVSVNLLVRRFDEARVAMPKPPERRTAAVADAPVSIMHVEQGMSVSRIARELGVARETVRRELILRGVAVRSISQGAKAAWSALTPEQRKLRVAAAHAKRGIGTPKPASFDPGHVPTKARKREHDAMAVVYRALCDAGMPPALGRDCGGMPVDMAYEADRLVVKVKGMPWSARKARIVEDVRLSAALAGLGWRQVDVWAGYGRSVDAEAVARTVREALAATGPAFAAGRRSPMGASDVAVRTEPRASPCAG